MTKYVICESMTWKNFDHGLCDIWTGTHHTKFEVKFLNSRNHSLFLSVVNSQLDSQSILKITGEHSHCNYALHTYGNYKDPTTRSTSNSYQKPGTTCEFNIKPKFHKLFNSIN